MSEAETEQTAEVETESTAETDWKAEARRYEKRAKELASQLRQASPQLQELATLKAASQTEAERQAAALSEAQQRAERAERDALRASVALRKGLPANLAARLQGDDEASLEADADELLSLIPQQESGVRVPRPDYSQGSSGKGAATSDPAQQFAGLIRQATGR